LIGWSPSRGAASWRAAKVAGAYDLTRRAVEAG
jgi:hypothetical protein